MICQYEAIAKDLSLCKNSNCEIRKDRETVTTSTKELKIELQQTRDKLDRVTADNKSFNDQIYRILNIWIDFVWFGGSLRTRKS